nr:cytochrome c biogenesis protein CcdC [Alkalihalobacillus pseudalcaliphilus]
MEPYYLIFSTLGAAIMAVIVIFIRLKSQLKPVTAKKIVLPPLFMSTGFLMFLYEPTHLHGIQIIESVALGILFSFLLIKTSKFERIDSHIYLKRSKMFVFILIGLLVVRILLRVVLGYSIEVETLAGMFFVMAFSMILPWRIAMLRSYKKIINQSNETKEIPSIHT